ncbi:MAG: NifB/NifX family molybdenum-iron cluster-binding protein [Spirochaetota bacterium]
MKHEMTAVSVYKERVSPLLDVAKKFAIYEIREGKIKQKIVAEIHTDDESQRIDKLKEIGVSVIIGGAVSCFMSEIIHEKGLKLFSWVSGPVDNIIDLYLKNRLYSIIPDMRKCSRVKRRRQCRHEI